MATHREVRVNAGEPERDDFPLPPVDIEIPDDAAEKILTLQDATSYIQQQAKAA